MRFVGNVLHTEMLPASWPPIAARELPRSWRRGRGLSGSGMVLKLRNQDSRDFTGNIDNAQRHLHTAETSTISGRSDRQGRSGAPGSSDRSDGRTLRSDMPGSIYVENCTLAKLRNVAIFGPLQILVDGGMLDLVILFRFHRLDAPGRLDE